MKMPSIEFEASMTPEAKEKIDKGEWRLNGVTIQDMTSGKMVGSLKTVKKEPHADYTPALFVALQNEICISQQLISAQIRDEFRSLKSSLAQGLRQIEDKIDFQTDITMGQIIGEINHFFSQFDNLKSGDTHRAEMILRDGGQLAARLAGMTDVLIRNYLGDVRLNVSSNTMTYLEYLALPSDNWIQMWGEVTQLIYPDLLKSRAKQFIPALTEIMNRLNIISICFYNELYMDYQDTLQALRSQLKNLLDQLVNGLPVRNGKFDDYAQRVFGKDREGKWIHENEADRLSQHYPEFSRNNLGARVFRQITHTQEDWVLVCSVREVLNMIDSIDNLLLRGEDLESGSILDTGSIAKLCERTFPPRREYALAT
jgi:hypothetical protein